MEELAPFIRMNGLGNEILVIDMRGRPDRVSPAAARALAADPAMRFDQIMAIHDPRDGNADQYIEVLNSDGSLAETCGNGMRCVVSVLSGETGRRAFRFETLAGILGAVDHEDGRISVDMGVPRLAWHEIPLSREIRDTARVDLHAGPGLDGPCCVSMGNPHAVFWAGTDVWSFPLERIGPELEVHPLFPKRANISIARAESRERIILRTWERGAGLTRACGSAACAAAVCGVRTGRTDRRVSVELPGGVLEIDWREDGHVMMTGPAETEFSGRLHPATGHWTGAA